MQICRQSPPVFHLVPTFQTFSHIETDFATFAFHPTQPHEGPSVQFSVLVAPGSGVVTVLATSAVSCASKFTAHTRHTKQIFPQACQETFAPAGLIRKQAPSLETLSWPRCRCDLHTAHANVFRCPTARVATNAFIH